MKDLEAATKDTAKRQSAMEKQYKNLLAMNEQLKGRLNDLKITAGNSICVCLDYSK